MWRLKKGEEMHKYQTPSYIYRQNLQLYKNGEKRKIVDDANLGRRRYG